MDANIAIALLHKRRRQTPSTRLAAHKRGEVVTSVIVAHELCFGAFKSASPARNRRRVLTFLADIQPLDFDAQDAEAAAHIRAELHAQGQPIGPFDCLIAGQARARGLVLISNNTREFRRVAGLVVEDWLVAAN